MIDYALFYRRSINPQRIRSELPKFDIFASAFNSSERVAGVFAQVAAARKIWLIHPEYQYSLVEEPSGYPIARPGSIDEIEQVSTLLAEMGDLAGKSVCVDITGFMRHVVVFLVAKLAHLGVKSFTALYSEPMHYVKQEQTTFATTTSGKVRPIRGLAGVNATNAKDHLIIAVGYDHKLIGEVTNYKDSSVIYPLFSFPSLSPDMYQQSAIRAAQSGDVALSGEWITNRRFAPANDPFSIAGMVSEVVREIDKKGEPASIYLSPLSTKVTALGFAVFWLLEGKARDAVTVLLPECLTYTRETSIGLKRLWSYTLEC